MPRGASSTARHPAPYEPGIMTLARPHADAPTTDTSRSASLAGRATPRARRAPGPGHRQSGAIFFTRTRKRSPPPGIRPVSAAAGHTRPALCPGWKLKRLTIQRAVPIQRYDAIRRALDPALPLMPVLQGAAGAVCSPSPPVPRSAACWHVGWRGQRVQAERPPATGLV